MTQDVTIKRLIYQSWHRGCKETDLILGKFAKAHLNNFTEEELQQYEDFISENDWDIYAGLTGKLPFPKKHQNKATDLLRKFDASH